MAAIRIENHQHIKDAEYRPGRTGAFDAIDEEGHAPLGHKMAKTISARQYNKRKKNLEKRSDIKT